MQPNTNDSEYETDFNDFDGDAVYLLFIRQRGKGRACFCTERWKDTGGILQLHGKLSRDCEFVDYAESTFQRRI